MNMFYGGFGTNWNRAKQDHTGAPLGGTADQRYSPGTVGIGRINPTRRRQYRQSPWTYRTQEWGHAGGPPHTNTDLSVAFLYEKRF